MNLNSVRRFLAVIVDDCLQLFKNGKSIIKIVPKHTHTQNSRIWAEINSMKISFAFAILCWFQQNWRRYYVIHTKPLPILHCLIKSGENWMAQPNTSERSQLQLVRQTVDVAEKAMYANARRRTTNAKRNSSFNRLKRQWKICCRQLHMGRDRQSHPKGMDSIKRVRVSPYYMRCIYSLSRSTLYPLLLNIISTDDEL